MSVSGPVVGGQARASEGARSALPPVYSNTGGSKTIDVENKGLTTDDFRAWKCGEDWFEGGLGVWWQEHEGLELWQALAGAKAKGIEENEDQVITWQGMKWVIGKRGVSEPFGEGFPYALWCEGIQFHLRGRNQPTGQSELQPSGTSANVRFRVTGGPLTVWAGVPSCWSKIQDIIALLKGDLRWNKLTRVDLCADTTKYAVSDFMKLWDAGQVVCRATGHTKHGECRKETGLSLGKAPLMLRIYDKLAELRQKGTPEKWALMEQVRWGCKPDRATRVEFELRREKLVDLGCGSVQDYLSKRGGLVNHLCLKWFRLTDRLPDCNHVYRALNHSIWNEVHEAFQEWAGKTDEVLRPDRAKLDIDPHGLMLQAVGCAVKAAGLKNKGRVIEDFNIYMSQIEQMIRPYLKDNFIEVQEKVQTELFCRGVYEQDDCPF
mgnify:CR=1 FL=1